jgi:hypothetical protein
MKKARCAAGIFGMGQNGYLVFRLWFEWFVTNQ